MWAAYSPAAQESSCSRRDVSCRLVFDTGVWRQGDRLIKLSWYCFWTSALPQFAFAFIDGSFHRSEEVFVLRSNPRRLPCEQTASLFITSAEVGTHRQKNICSSFKNNLFTFAQALQHHRPLRIRPICGAHLGPHFTSIRHNLSSSPAF